MKYSACFIALLTIFSFSTNAAEDEYTYMEPPVANQIADLMDDDKDGVINARDLCAETPVGSDINNDGCERYKDDTEDWDLKVLFANDSSRINPVFINELESMVSFLEKYPETSIELQGHASIVGKTNYNQALSERRAKKIKDAIVSMGVSPDRIKIVGYGETVVDATGESPVAHAVNRRVVATVVGYDHDLVKEWTVFTTRPK
ncbi:hypothetical protein DI392_00015 [Vibrio albus]|uniref:OmpA-like domain-containing protein n=1 Tax=Vibrio albus TaxID=2200953 RepID=A0A2U3BD84_9VIBR|nr:OmpA family protein [Vibrio albus]PWI34712.1 hypothetical protein DI392_00015 [Vibrio albus]